MTFDVSRSLHDDPVLEGTGPLCEPAEGSPAHLSGDTRCQLSSNERSKLAKALRHAASQTSLRGLEIVVEVALQELLEAQAAECVFFDVDSSTLWD